MEDRVSIMEDRLSEMQASQKDADMESEADYNIPVG